jgi:hypothetical protein
MTTKNKFLPLAFSVQSELPQPVPGFDFVIPAGKPAYLKLHLLYDCPPDVDGLLSLSLDTSLLAYSSLVFDGSHQVESPPDPNSDIPVLAQNFRPILPTGIRDIEMPGVGIIFKRNGLFAEFFFIGGQEDVPFNVEFRQKAEGTLPSTIRFAKAEYLTA